MHTYIVTYIHVDISTLGKEVGNEISFKNVHD